MMTGFQLPPILWNLFSPPGDDAGLGRWRAAWVTTRLIDAAGHMTAAHLGERVLGLFLNCTPCAMVTFHADMHQGNLKVAPNGDIIAYDFGIMGHIDAYTRRVYAEILFGFIRNATTNAWPRCISKPAMSPLISDVDEFARALRAVGEPIFGMDAAHISMGRLLNYLFEVTERFGMETRTELILLQRTMVVVEGVARSLNPNMNIWQVASPIVTDYIQKSIGPRAVVKDLYNTARVLSRFGPRLPRLVEQALIAQSNPAPEKRNGFWRWIILAAAIGLLVGGGLTLLIEALL